MLYRNPQPARLTAAAEGTLSGTLLLIIIVYLSSALKYSFCGKDHTQIVNIKIKRNNE